MRLETRYINLGEIIREREKFYAYDKMLCVFNFTSVKFLNDDYDDYDLVSRNCMYIFFERDNEDKKFDVVLRSCNKQWPNFSDQHSNISAKMWSKRGNREILTFLGFVPLLNQRTLRTTVLTGVALIGFCVIWKINFTSKRIVNLKWQKRKIEESIWWWKKKIDFYRILPYLTCTTLSSESISRSAVIWNYNSCFFPLILDKFQNFQIVYSRSISYYTLFLYHNYKLMLQKYCFERYMYIYNPYP